MNGLIPVNSTSRLVPSLNESTRWNLFLATPLIKSLQILNKLGRNLRENFTPHINNLFHIYQNINLHVVRLSAYWKHRTLLFHLGTITLSQRKTIHTFFTSIQTLSTINMFHYRIQSCYAFAASSITYDNIYNQICRKIVYAFSFSISISHLAK